MAHGRAKGQDIGAADDAMGQGLATAQANGRSKHNTIRRATESERGGGVGVRQGLVFAAPTAAATAAAATATAAVAGVSAVRRLRIRCGSRCGGVRGFG